MVNFFLKILWQKESNWVNIVVKSMVLASLLTMTGFAAVIYKFVDRQGNVIFSDRPLPNTEHGERVKLAEPSKQQEKQAQKKLKGIKRENAILSKRLAEKRQRLESASAAIQAIAAKLKIVEQAMTKAYVNWQAALVTLQSDASKYNQKRALLLERTYEQTKRPYAKLQQELAKAERQRNSLK